jgi:hypothetical protein
MKEDVEEGDMMGAEVKDGCGMSVGYLVECGGKE